MLHILNNFRARKLGNRYFVTTDHGSHCVLSESEFKQLKQNKLDKIMGLLEEREIILNDRNLEEAVRLTRNRYNFLARGTSLHIVVVTKRCNMKCIYCQASSETMNRTGFDMDMDTAKKTVDFIFQTPSKGLTIEFQGGEPLLNWGVVKYIIKYARKRTGKDLRISFVTNMTEMDNEKMNFLIDNDIGVCTSLDGPKELHDHNRKFFGGSNYGQVVKWIKRFNEYNKKNMNSHINALVTLTRESLKHPEEIVDEYVELGLKQIHLRFLNNLGVAKKAWTTINYSVDEYLDFWKKAVEHIETLKEKGIEIDERIVTIMTRKIGTEFDANYLDLRSPCGAAIGQLVYDFNGDIFTCDEARMIDEDLFKLGNVNKDIYSDVVTCDKACAVINSSINDQYICDNCVYKPYCGVCPVCNYAEQGNIVGKISETDRCRIYKAQFDWVVDKKFIKVDKKG